MFISELARNVKSLDIDKILAESVEANKEYIADLNTAQLSKGKDSNNETLNPGLKSPMYAQMKVANGGLAPLGIPDLKNTGEFWEGWTVKPDEKGFVMTSTDSKTSKLKSIYGEDIFGLTNESKKDLKSVLLPTINKKIKDDLQRT